MILTLALVIASASLGGASAYFSDTETSIGNTFVAAVWGNPLDIYDVEGDGEWQDNMWLVSMYASENKSTTVTLANYSEEDVNIVFSVSPASQDSGNLTFGFDNTALFIPAKEKADVVFWVQTTQSVTPGSYSTNVTINLIDSESIE